MNGAQSTRHRADHPPAAATRFSGHGGSSRPRPEDALVVTAVTSVTPLTFPDPLKAGYDGVAVRHHDADEEMPAAAVRVGIGSLAASERSLTRVLGRRRRSLVAHRWSGARVPRGRAMVGIVNGARR